MTRRKMTKETPNEKRTLKNKSDLKINNKKNKKHYWEQVKHELPNESQEIIINQKIKIG